jgi:hypothetical protein
MPSGKEDLPELLRYIPWWRKGDPGPDWPWIIEEVSAEARVQLVVSQLEFEKEVAAAQTKAIERNIAILKGGAAKKP